MQTPGLVPYPSLTPLTRYVLLLLHDSLTSISIKSNGFHLDSPHQCTSYIRHIECSLSSLGLSQFHYDEYLHIRTEKKKKINTTASTSPITAYPHKRGTSQQSDLNKHGSSISRCKQCRDGRGGAE